MMTRFEFVAPRCLKEADALLDSMDERGEDYFDSVEGETAVSVSNKRMYMEDEARWRWIADNKDEIGRLEVDTVNKIYCTGGVVKVFDKYDEYLCEFTVYDRNIDKYLKRKVKRFDISTNFIYYV